MSMTPHSRVNGALTAFPQPLQIEVDDCENEMWFGQLVQAQSLSACFSKRIFSESSFRPAIIPNRLQDAISPSR